MATLLVPKELVGYDFYPSCIDLLKSYIESNELDGFRFFS